MWLALTAIGSDRLSHIMFVSIGFMFSRELLFGLNRTKMQAGMLMTSRFSRGRLPGTV